MIVIHEKEKEKEMEKWKEKKKKKRIDCIGGHNHLVPGHITHQY
jgi:hypothetical protein